MLAGRMGPMLNLSVKLLTGIVTVTLCVNSPWSNCVAENIFKRVLIDWLKILYSRNNRCTLSTFSKICSVYEKGDCRIVTGMLLADLVLKVTKCIWRFTFKNIFNIWLKIVFKCDFRFLVEATAVLEKHLELEGIFRKSGSVARQKELKVRGICSWTVNLPNTVHVPHTKW